MNKPKADPEKDEEFEIRLLFMTIKAKNPTVITVLVIIAALVTLVLIAQAA